MTDSAATPLAERCQECLCPLCHHDSRCPSCHGRGIGDAVRSDVGRMNAEEWGT